jgi:anti-sigma factor RsiW
MSQAPGISCKEFVELVTEYFDGALSQDDVRRFEHHIEECFWCGRYLEQMRVTIETVGRIDEESISPDAKDSLLHAFRDWTAGRQATET